MPTRRERIAFLEQHLSEARKLQLKRVLALRTRRFTVVLENVYHPENANAVLRTAECVGLQEVHLIQEKFAWKYNRNIARGAGKWLEIHESDKGVELLARLQARGFALVVTSAAPGSLPPEELPLDRPIALIFGNESVGVTAAAEAMADYKVHIPMQGFTESFNIAVSSGILLYGLAHRIRTNADYNWQLSPDEQDEMYEEWLKKAIKFSGPLLEKLG